VQFRCPEVCRVVETRGRRENSLFFGSVPVCEYLASQEDDVVVGRVCQVVVSFIPDYPSVGNIRNAPVWKGIQDLRIRSRGIENWISVCRSLVDCAILA